MNRPLTRREREALLAPWRGCYHRLRIRSSGAVEAQRRPGDPWGVLMTPERAARQLRHAGFDCDWL
jgi:hypothetical protein